MEADNQILVAVGLQGSKNALIDSLVETSPGMWSIVVGIDCEDALKYAKAVKAAAKELGA